MGIFGLFTNALAARQEEHEQKQRDHLKNVLEAWYVYSHPNAARDQYNALQNLHTELGEMYGPEYKQHKPLLNKIFGGIGHAVLNSMGVPLHQRTPYIPESMRSDEDLEAIEQGQQMPQFTAQAPPLPSGTPQYLAAPGEPAAPFIPQQ